MSTRTRLTGVRWPLVSLALLISATIPVDGQQKWTAPKTSWGHPDLQGIWSAQAEDLTPLERPACTPQRPDACKQTVISEAEYQERLNIADNRAAVAEGSADDPTGAITSRQVGLVGGVGAHIWYQTSPSRPSRRSSKIVDPADGRIPPYSAEGQKRVDAEAASSLKSRRERGGAAASAAFWKEPMDGSWFNAAGIGLQSRCLSKSVPAIYYPNAYGANLQILQTPTHVVLVAEIYHEVRVVPLDGRPHVSSAVREWLGNSRGHWEGDTLVIEATNFRERILFGGDEPPVSENYKVVERFTRTEENKISHQVTMIDPATWSRPITLEIDHYKDPKQTQIMEYACHEGNSSIFNAVIGGVRTVDAAANAGGAKE